MILGTSSDKNVLLIALCMIWTRLNLETLGEMSMKNFVLLLVSLALSAGVLANDNLRISGFGSLVAGQVLDGSGYVADYPNLGIYDDELDLGQETRFGIQANATLDENLTATMQVMTRANNDYEAEVEWMFINYAITDDLELQAGKLRLPVYYYSEYMDVGIAYPWVRVPSDAYSLDVTNFTGLQLNHRTFLGSTSFTTTLYTGRQTNNSDELMSYLFDNDPGDVTGVGSANVDRTFTNILGVGFEVNRDSTIAKISFTQSDFDETIVNSFTAEADGTIEFIDVYLQQNFGPVSVMLEYNDYDPFYSSYFVSATYTLGMHTFYVMNSKFELDAKDGTGVPFEEHDTNSLGVRCNLGVRTALKFDISMINDTGATPVNQDPNNDGDATIFTTSLDFMF